MSCSITEILIDGLRGIFLENDRLRVGILVDRGSDIFEFYSKQDKLDFLLRLPKGIRNPQKHFSQIRNTASQFEDYYYGGWQVCLPNSPAFNYRGAELGQHGEVALIPWSCEVLTSCKDAVSIRCRAIPLRVPISIERTFTLKNGSSTLLIDEVVQNEGRTSLDVMWGQHIAFGGRFLEDGVSISTNARTMSTEPSMPENHRFRRGETYLWPAAKRKDGRDDDASEFFAAGSDIYSDLAYLQGFGSKAFYAVTNRVKNTGFALTWEGDLFKELWMWQERNATQGFPWWGQCFTLALEPWTSRWTSDPLGAIDRNEWLRVEPGQKISASFAATAFNDKFSL